MGRHARPLGGTGDEARPPTGRRRAPERSADTPSPPVPPGPAVPDLRPGPGRHRAPAIPVAVLPALPATTLPATTLPATTLPATTPPTPNLGRVSAASAAPDRAHRRPKTGERGPASHRRHRAAPRRRAPAAVPALAGAAAVAVTAVGAVTLTGGPSGSGGVTVESVAGAGTAAELQRVVVPERATRAQLRAALTSKAATQARSRAAALRDARLAAAAAARLAELQRACGYNPWAQKDETLNREQLRNARIIVDVAQRMGLPPRAAVIAIATALQESYLKNLSGGHLDSAGLFQQRPSAGWGSYAQVTNPLYSARKFYLELQEVNGWRRLPVTVAAQDVQVSAFPSAYARWEAMAAEVVSRVLNVPVDSLNCTPR